MPYRILVRRSALKELEALPGKIRVRITSEIEALATDPRPAGAIKLTGADLYRIRAGEIRVVYSIEDDRLIVIIVRVGHRGDVHRNLQG